MNTFISMLRGINVSGQKKMRMVELKTQYKTKKLANVETYLQSGNVIFDSPSSDSSTLAELTEAQIKTILGFSVRVFIRGNKDFRRIIKSNPFMSGRFKDPAKLHATFLYNSPPVSKLTHLALPKNETAEFSIGEKKIFLFCPNGYGRTKLSNSFFERKLDTPSATKNWKTVHALYKMANERKPHSGLRA